MDFFRRFTFLVCTPGFQADDLEGQRLLEIIGAVERLGFHVVKARRIEDAEIAVQTDAAIGCMLVDWGKRGLEGKTAALIDLMRKRGLDMPIVVLVRRKRFEDIPVEVMDYIDGYVFLAEETPEFIARNLVSRLKQYAETLKTPFFGALVDYAEEGNQLWTCPGHNGGIFYNRSPIGRIFVEHLGEAVFRDDLDNSVLELGDLLTHEGPALKAQKEAAKIFGAEKTYFVLNGTSTSNKVVLTALVAEGDLVLFDRNNHKAAHHGALLIAGGIPVYLETDRNAYGLIGPIYADALDEEAIRERIRRHPLIEDPEAWRRPRPFRVAVIEQCTYDGTIYSAETIVKRIGHLCDYILFDEAWGSFMKFHPLYAGRFAMGLQDLGPDEPGIIATQSTHKQLAGFSQASQIHVKDRHIKGQSRRVEHRRFNESFMQYASTSPFYPLFASLDVGAQMMKGRSGVVLWDDTVRLGIEVRKKVRTMAREIAEREREPDRRWFFEPFVPDTVAVPDPSRPGATIDVPWEDLPTDELASNPQHWSLAPGRRWHGFGHVEAGFAITDPAKLTLLTPGFDRSTGNYTDFGIPAPVVAEYLRENQVVPEKNDLNSLLFLLTPGVESSKAGTLMSALAAFKKLHDDNAPLDEVLIDFVRRRPARYRGLRLRDLCDEIHAFYRAAGTSALQQAQFAPAHLPEIAMTPHAAAQMLVRNTVDYLPIDEIADRVATTLFVVYPPGIATIVPGERMGPRARPMLDYLKTFERGANLFPGFEAEIQGLFREVQPDGTVLFHTYVVRGGMTRGDAPAILVRHSTDADVPFMLAIYRHHVTHGVRDLDEDGAGGMAPFDAEDLKQRRKSMRKHRLPHLVAEIDGEVAGYAYVVPFRKRPAYRYTVKHSIYVHPDRLGCGVGRALLPALVEACAAAGYRQLVGYIDGANATSLKLHEACGFAIVGRLPAVAYRFDRWADTVTVQRALGSGSATPPDPWGKEGPVTAAP